MTIVFIDFRSSLFIFLLRLLPLTHFGDTPKGEIPPTSYFFIILLVIVIGFLMPAYNMNHFSFTLE